MRRTAGGVGPLGEDPGRAAIGVLEPGAGSQGVHQVVRDIDAAHGRGDRLGVRDVSTHRLHGDRPGIVTQFARRAGQATHTVTGLQQFRYQAASDVPGRSGDQTVQLLRAVLSVLVHAHLSRHSIRRCSCVLPFDHDCRPADVSATHCGRRPRVRVELRHRGRRRVHGQFSPPDAAVARPPRCPSRARSRPMCLTVRPTSPAL